MKRKPVFWIILIVVAALVAAGVVWGKRYYDGRYVGSDYYTLVSPDYGVTPVPIYDSVSKEQVGMGVKYELTAYNEQGEAKTVEFTVMEDSGNVPRPGTYLLVSASKQIVLDWRVIGQGDVPQKALDEINSTR